MPSKHLILCRPLLLLPYFFPNIRIFSNQSALRIRWSNYWSFTISPSNEYSGLIPFRIDWFDLLAVQGTLKSLSQHHNLKESFLLPSACLMVQLSHPYICDYWKNHSFDYMDLCWQSDVSALYYAVQVCHSFSSKEQASSTFVVQSLFIHLNLFLSKLNKLWKPFVNQSTSLSQYRRGTE